MSRTASIVLFAILWAILSTYLYVCQIKDKCSAKEPTLSTAPARAEKVVNIPENEPKPEPKKVLEPKPKPMPEPEIEKKPEPTPEPEQKTQPKKIVEKKPAVCTDYLTGYLKRGRAANKAADAKKVEEFLNEYQGENLAVDSTYGEKDIEAIKRFQAKYKKEVLDPHGLPAPTGHVLNTTRAQINKLYCAQKERKNES